MPEEYIDDIISDSEPAKTEAEMVAEIQGPEVDKPAEKQPEAEDTKSTNADREARPPDVVQGEKEQDPKTDPVKDLAAQLGWREDHTGDDAVDAKTYILKSKDIQKSMGQHNKDLKDQLHALNGSVSALKEHNDTVYKADIKKLQSEVDGLKKERRDAIELADVSKVEELDEQIDAKQKDIDAPKAADKQEAAATDNPATDNPAYDEWIKDNDWYVQDDEMAKFADTVAQQYNGAPLDRVYAIVRTKVQEVFPDKFESAKVVNDSQAVPAAPPIGPKSPVEGSSAKGSEGSFTKADLTQDQLQIMRQFVSGGIMTEEQYVNDIAKMQ